MPSWIQRLNKWNLLSEKTLLQWYPPFLFLGMKVCYLSPDYKHLHVYVPLRWYGKNLHGSMFGGILCAISDPLPALLCTRLFPEVRAWTKANSVEFLRPARTGVYVIIEIPLKKIKATEKMLKKEGRGYVPFDFYIQDKKNHKIAKVKNVVYLRKVHKK